MTVDEATEVLGYLLGHEKAVDSGEMEDVQNCLNSQEQEALKVILSEFRELKEKAIAPEVDVQVYAGDDGLLWVDVYVNGEQTVHYTQDVD